MEKTREGRTRRKGGKWEAAGPTRQKKNEEKGGRGGAGGRGAGGGRRVAGPEGAGQQNSKTTELQRGSRKAKARERNIGRKGSGAGPRGGAGATKQQNDGASTRKQESQSTRTKHKKKRQWSRPGGAGRERRKGERKRAG